MDEGARPEDGSEQVFPLSEGQFFGLGNFLNELEAQDRTLSPTVMDMGSDAVANMFKLSLSDVLSLAPQDGLYQIQLTEDVNDQLVITPGEWTTTGQWLNHGEQSHVVYNGTSDVSAQLLIDQHMLVL